MDKTELLLHMMEQPEKYDDKQWREILADKECRTLYAMMSATRSAMDAERFDRQADDTLQQWERLAAQHPHAGSTTRPLWRRVATVATVAAVFAVFASLVVAAVHTHGFGLLQQDRVSQQASLRQPTSSVDVSSDVTQGQEETSTLQDEAHLYDNVPLEQIIDDMAARYDAQVEWQSSKAKSLRLYYRWEPSYSIDKVVDMLNSFQAFTISRTGNKLIISDIEGDQ